MPTLHSLTTAARRNLLSIGLVLALATAGTAACRTSAEPPPGAASSATQESTSPSTHTIDTALRQAWASESVTPAKAADDATFLRRAYLDLAGTLPSEERARSFLADTSPDKRDALVRELVASPESARHFARVWDQILMGPEARSPVVDRGAFRRWLEAEIAANTPWNELVTKLVSAEGVASVGGARGARGMIADDDKIEAEKTGDINAATNWVLRYFDRPQDLAGTASSVFLGVQIQCAQCHDHKTESWKQDDFRAFASSFARIGAKQVGDYEKGQLRRVELVDGGRMPRKWRKDPELVQISETAPRALDGTALAEGDRRAALAKWITSPENPYFAKAMVNRVWGMLLGRGFVEPVDDFRPSNPALVPELLDALAKDFADSGFDMRRLVTTIATSQPYALASSPDGKLWSSFESRPLSTDVALDAVMTAANLEPVLERVSKGHADELLLRVRRQLAFAFAEDAESNPAELLEPATIPSALLYMNGNLLQAATRKIPEGTLDEVLSSKKGADERISALYLRALSRMPTEAELAHWRKFVAEGSPAGGDGVADEPAAEEGKGKRGKKAGKKANGKKPQAKKGNKGGDAMRRTVPSRARTDEERAYEDLFWALLNSSEFGVQH